MPHGFCAINQVVLYKGHNALQKQAKNFADYINELFSSCLILQENHAAFFSKSLTEEAQAAITETVILRPLSVSVYLC